MTRIVLSRRASLSAAALLTVVACQVADLSAPPRLRSPDVALPDRADGVREPEGRTRRPIDCQARDALVASGQLGPRGGVLRIGESKLVVPPGALRATVRITATRRSDAPGTIDFQPDGLRFRKAAGLVLSASGCDAPPDDDVAVVHLGTRGEILETITASFDRRRNEVVAPITHFSGYAIAF